MSVYHDMGHEGKRRNEILQVKLYSSCKLRFFMLFAINPLIIRIIIIKVSYYQS